MYKIKQIYTTNESWVSVYEHTIIEACIYSHMHCRVTYVCIHLQCIASYLSDMRM